MTAYPPLRQIPEGSGKGRLWGTLTRSRLRIIKTLTHLLPSDWASKAESALRIFGLDRALLLVEGIAIAKLAMLAVAYPFRRGR
jgi:hypothetical protein